MEPFFEQLYNYNDDQNPNSAQEELPPFMINYVSPFLDDHELPLSEILHQQPLALANHADSACMEINMSTVMANEVQVQAKPSKKSNLGVGPTPRKRTGKKDRHSKICTAQGIRDRRMRLSLHIARKFFDLQDMLGFDKASKTIEWLFSKSKKDIKELSDNMLQAKESSSSKENHSDQAFMSECEVLSAMEEKYSNSEGVKKVAYISHQVRESRDKARTRARERTKEKMMIKSLEKTQELFDPNPNKFDQLGFFSQFETLEETTSLASSNSIEHQLVNMDMTVGNHPGTDYFTQMACPFLDTCELSKVVHFKNDLLGFLDNRDKSCSRINYGNDGTMIMSSEIANADPTSLVPSKFPFNLH